MSEQNKRNYYSCVGLIKHMSHVSIPDKKKQKNYTVTDLSISVKEIIKGVAKITLVPVEAWGMMSDKCKEFQEGDLVKIEGRFTNKVWKDKNQQERKLNVIVMETMELMLKS